MRYPRGVATLESTRDGRSESITLCRLNPLCIIRYEKGPSPTVLVIARRHEPMLGRAIGNFSILAGICLILSGCGGKRSAREANKIRSGGGLFDIELVDGQTIEEDDFHGILPMKMFGLRGDMSLEEMSQIHGLESEDNGRDSRGSMMWDIDIVDDHAFTGGIFYMDSKGLEKIQFWGGMPIPSRGRVERCYASIKRLIGEPDGMYHLKKNKRPKPESTLAIRWRIAPAENSSFQSFLVARRISRVCGSTTLMHPPKVVKPTRLGSAK